MKKSIIRMGSSDRFPFSSYYLLCLVFIGCLALASDCNPDEDCIKECKNGGTLDDVACDCTCDPQSGYTGELCDEEKVPVSMKIVEIKVLNFPETNGGNAWDGGVSPTSRPDLKIHFWQMNVDCTESEFRIGSTKTKTNAQSGVVHILQPLEGDGIVITGPAICHRAILYDDDGADGSPGDPIMTSAKFTPYELNQGFPDKITLTGVNTNMVVELTVEYEWL